MSRKQNLTVTNFYSRVSEVKPGDFANFSLHAGDRGTSKKRPQNFSRRRDDKKFTTFMERKPRRADSKYWESEKNRYCFIFNESKGKKCAGPSRSASKFWVTS